MAPHNRPLAQNKYSEQYILNASYDEIAELLAVELVGFDGQNTQRMNADNLQIKSVSSGGYDYFCFSAPGTATASALWQAFRIDSSGNLLYADANASFDNVATDPTALTYGYT